MLPPAETGQSGAQVAVHSGKEEAAQAGIQNQMILALVASLLAVGLIVAALIWLARHRTRNAVESKMICVACNSENPNSAVSCSCCGSPLRPETALTPALPVGTRLQGDLYSIGKVLGQGGFGITYLGSDTGLKRAVAIKEFFPQVQGCSRDGAMVQPGGMITHLEYQQEKDKFLAEGQWLAQFHHPSIVKVFSLFEENNTAYMVMEFLRGKTLLKIVEEDGRLEERDAVAYIVQIAVALDVIHGLKLLHRDIKPENIIIT